MVVHSLLLCNGFTLKEGITFKAVDDDILEYEYISCYRTEFIYEITYILKDQYLVICMTVNPTHQINKYCFREVEALIGISCFFFIANIKRST